MSHASACRWRASASWCRSGSGRSWWRSSGLRTRVTCSSRASPSRHAGRTRSAWCTRSCPRRSWRRQRLSSRRASLGTLRSRWPGSRRPSSARSRCATASRTPISTRPRVAPAAARMPARDAAPCWRSGARSSAASREARYRFALSARLLDVLHLGAVGLVVADEEGLQSRRDILPIEVALLVRLHLGGALPEAHGEAGVLVLRVLEQPSSTQALDLPALGGHGGVIRLLELVP